MVRLTPEGKLHIDIGLRTQTHNHEAIVLSPNDPIKVSIVDQFYAKFKKNVVENYSIDNEGPVIILEPENDTDAKNLLVYLDKASSNNRLFSVAPISELDSRIAVVFIKRNMDTLDDARRIERLTKFESIMECYRLEQLLANGGRIS